MQRFERECFWERMIEVYLFAQFHTYCIGLFEEDSISPQIIPEWSKLVVLPLPEGPGSYLFLLLSPCKLYNNKQIYHLTVEAVLNSFHWHVFDSASNLDFRQFQLITLNKWVYLLPPLQLFPLWLQSSTSWSDASPPPADSGSLSHNPVQNQYINPHA